MLHKLLIALIAVALYLVVGTVVTLLAIIFLGLHEDDGPMAVWLWPAIPLVILVGEVMAITEKIFKAVLRACEKRRKR